VVWPYLRGRAVNLIMSKLDILIRERFFKYFAYIFMGGLFIFLFHLSWLKWGNLFTDTFRDPWIVDGILSGKVVYRDLFYEYGFLPPYTLAALCLAFGYHLNVFIFCGAALAVGCGTLIYRILRLFAARFIAVMVVSIFFVVFVFGQYYYQTIFNFILPYSFASIFFVFFSLAALYCFLKFIDKRRTAYLYFWAIFMILVFLSRPIMGSLVYIGFLPPYLICAVNSFFPSRRQALGFLLVPIAAGIALYAIFLAAVNGWAGFGESILLQFSRRDYMVDAGYALRSTGLDQVAFNVAMAVSTAALVFLSIALLAWAVKFFVQRKKVVCGAVLVASAMIIAALFLMNIEQYRHLPLMMGLLVLWSAWRAATGIDTKHYVSLCAVFSLGFFMALRIVLNAKPAGGGFCFLTIALIGYYVYFFTVIPDFMAGRFKDFSRRIFSILIFIFFIFINTCYPIISWAFLVKHTVPVISFRGGIIATDDRMSHVFEEAAVYLHEHADKNATVTAVPEISGINFFSGHRNNLRYYTLNRALLRLCGDDAVINEFKAKAPDYLAVLLSRDLQYGVFGEDYGLKLNMWIVGNYRLEKVISDYQSREKAGGGIGIFRRAPRSK